MLTTDPELNAIFFSHLKLYRKLLSSGLQSFQAANPEVIARMVSTDPAFSKPMENPAKYGAVNATCWDPDGVSCVCVNKKYPP
jgi:hypothetical protein